MKIYFKYYFSALCGVFFTFFSTAQDIDYAKAVVDTLSSVEMAGRGYTKSGDKKAALYIANEFQKMGLNGFNNVYFQNFNININTFEAQQNLKINGKTLSLGNDFILASNCGSGKGRVSAVHFSEIKFGKKYKNSALIINADDYKKITSEEKFSWILKTFKIIIVRKEKLTASLANYNLPIPIVEVLTEHTNNIKKCEFEINAFLKKNHETQNVIAFKKGSIHADSSIIICAHYDHLGNMGNIYFPGANDNAAGIAMLLNLAQKYSAENPKYTIIFIAFGAEEAGLLGSEFFVNNPLIDLKKIKFVMNLDLVGTGQEGITVVNGTVFENHYKKLIAINDSLKFFEVIKARGAAANSDHYHFSQRGIPSFFIYMMGEPKAYHDIYDVADKLPLYGFENLFKLVYTFLEN